MSVLVIGIHGALYGADLDIDLLTLRVLANPAQPDLAVAEHHA
jgi:hypothetical protein